MRSRYQTVLILFLLCLFGAPAAAQVKSSSSAPFPNFESGPSQPIMLNANGKRLYVLNTADHRLEIYKVPAMKHLGSIFTGLEPVSMAIDPNDANTMYVVNALSDSVAVVDLAEGLVLDTIAVGDDPADIEIADGRIFVSVARAFDIGGGGTMLENLVVVADAAPPYAVTHQIQLQAVRPRALTSDGTKVYVAPLHSGNHTTILPWPDSVNLIGDQTVRDAHDLTQGWELNEALTDPIFDGFVAGQGIGWAIPETARIVTDSEFPAHVPQLPDNDILSIDIASVTLDPATTKGVGTTLFDMQRNPADGTLWVVNTEAKNRTRMEYNLEGDAFVNQVTIATGGAVAQIVPLDTTVTSQDHAQPVALAFYDGSEGSFAYIAAHGTATVVVLDATNPATVIAEIAVGEMPLGLAVDNTNDALYVYTRGDKRVHTYDIAAGHSLAAPVADLPYDPEPDAVVEGRTHLYDARASSGHGSNNFSCASCHVFGHTDFLAWDLGNSAGGLTYFFPDLMQGTLSFGGPVAGTATPVTNPMKGPMTTQSLRGSADDVPLHWRGDRRFFHMFRGAFEGLNGGSGVSNAAMQEYITFLSYMRFPPNPHSPKDRVYTGTALTGKNEFGINATGTPYNQVPQPVRCDSCHLGEFNNKTNFKGSQRTVNFDGPEDLFNTATLRGVYEKENIRDISGFGLSHTGEKDNVRDFLDTVLQVGAIEAFLLHGNGVRNRIAEFTTKWDTGISSLVGDQFHWLPGRNAAANAWLDLAEAQAADPNNNIDLIFKGWLQLANGTKEVHGGHYRFDVGSGTWKYLADTGKLVTRAQVQNFINAGRVELTFTAVPVGTGERLGIDRDEDGLLDGQELRPHGTDPADPDTDDDGFEDGLEVQLASDPLVFDAAIGDAVPPEVVAGSIVTNHKAFVDVATVSFLTSEPSTILLEYGLSAGNYTLGSVSDNDLKQRFDLIMSGLPADTTIFYRITPTDASGNAGTPAENSVTTKPPIYHVESITESVTGAGPYTVEMVVEVLDHLGNPVVASEVAGFWYSDIADLGGTPPQAIAITDGTGKATFTLGPYTPAASTDITFMVNYVGSVTFGNPFFVGNGGSTPNFFYFQPDNKDTYKVVTLP